MVPIGSTAPITGFMLTEEALDMFHCRVERPPMSIMAGFAVKVLITGELGKDAPAVAPPGAAWPSDDPEPGLTVTFTVALLLFVPSLAVRV